MARTPRPIMAKRLLRGVTETAPDSAGGGFCWLVSLLHDTRI
ncbi:hypothetical protein AcetOrient_orf00295p (plasmid) [Acetobacter orientalis]|uniref:Uncharacterized protein n=1 Tax=Acetobacter orientalis TaxID=146474 RepID=A0A2Z5ZN53_9PROT|nr:hypothetical protein AcetOrient_orf00295p [Acetobacter orientalis]